MKEVLDLFLHLPDHLLLFTQQHGNLIYGLLFLIIFCETGLVVTPFLPGDSLLFAIGAIAAKEGSGINIWMAAGVLITAAILGDSTNYWIGRRLGQWMLARFPRIVKPKHIDKTNEFFLRYGGKTIILARFVPIVRTFTPFVAGMGRMNYGRFLGFSVFSAFFWVGLVLPAGWILGRIPFFHDHFELVVLAIVGVSILPMVIEFLKARSRSKKAALEATEL
ncbi:MAG: dedA 1 [Akkermansiaceae bacterium]|nr:dedA 1 [Akkermansiaceae bacterium]